MTNPNMHGTALERDAASAEKLKEISAIAVEVGDLLDVIDEASDNKLCGALLCAKRMLSIIEGLAEELADDPVATEPAMAPVVVKKKAVKS